MLIKQIFCYSAYSEDSDFEPGSCSQNPHASATICIQMDPHFLKLDFLKIFMQDFKLVLYTTSALAYDLLLTEQISQNLINLIVLIIIIGYNL